MKIAVISCAKYADAWKPFFQLLQRFGGDLPSTPWLVTDSIPEGSLPTVPLQTYEASGDWCAILKSFAMYCAQDDVERIMLFQEDFFLTAPIDWSEVHAADCHFGAGAVRLYPCPGADGPPYGHNGTVGVVSQGADYRVSCQVTLWRPSYLVKILEACSGGPYSFEIDGTKRSRELDDLVLAWNRDVTPWPIRYLCSAISRGKWNPDAKPLCESHGIHVDWEKRGFYTNE